MEVGARKKLWPLCGGAQVEDGVVDVEHEGPRARPRLLPQLELECRNAPGELGLVVRVGSDRRGVVLVVEELLGGGGGRGVGGGVLVEEAPPRHRRRRRFGRRCDQGGRGSRGRAHDHETRATGFWGRERGERVGIHRRARRARTELEPEHLYRRGRDARLLFYRVFEVQDGRRRRQGDVEGVGAPLEGKGEG